MHSPPSTRQGRVTDAPSSLRDLLDGTAALIRRFVVMTPEQVDATALWVAHTHAIAASDFTPYIHITSAGGGSGKSRLIEVLESVVANPWRTEYVTPAALAKATDGTCVTVLLDETDEALKTNKQYAAALTGILNSGFRRGNSRSVDGRTFDVFAAKAIAGIGELPGTLPTRVVRIELKRKAATEEVERWSLRAPPAAVAEIREGLARWAATSSTIESLEALEASGVVKTPAGLTDRAEDVWAPLLAIADTAGGDWPGRASTAALALMTGDGRPLAEEEALSRDTQRVFAERRAEQLATQQLVDALLELPAGRWAALGLNAHKLGALLSKHGIGPQKMRIGIHRPRGYRRTQFSDFWLRYPA